MLLRTYIQADNLKVSFFSRVAYVSWQLSVAC